MLTPYDSFTGDFDISVRFRLTDVIRPSAGRESGVYIKVVLSDDERHQPEVMFRQAAEKPNGERGLRELEARLGLRPPGTSSHFRRVRGITCEDAVEMRIARYGTTAYLLGRPSREGPEILIATLEVPPNPVSSRGVFFMVHALGEGRETRATLENMTIRANGVISEATPQGLRP